MRALDPFPDAVRARPDELLVPIRQLQQIRFHFRVGCAKEVPRHWHRQEVREERIRLDKRSLPADRDRARVYDVDALNRAVAEATPEQRQLGILADGRREGEILGRKGRPIVPLRTLPNAPVRLHSPVGKKLPEAVLDRGNLFREARAEDAAIARVGEADVQELLGLTRPAHPAARRELRERRAERARLPGDRRGDPLVRRGLAESAAPDGRGAASEQGEGQEPNGESRGAHRM